MHTALKNLVGVAVIIAVLLGAGALWKYSSAYSRSIEPLAFRSFTVQGESTVVAVPDVGLFSFGVITQGGKDVTGLQTENTKKVNQALAFIKSKGVDPKDIKTSMYTVAPRYTYKSCEQQSICPPPEIAGYEVQQTVEVKVRTFEHISDLLGGVVERGANHVSQLQFIIDDPDMLRTQARAQAIAKAREKAGEIAKAGGVRVGRLLSIDDNVVSPPMPMMDSALSYGRASSAQEKMIAPMPTVEPGSHEIRVTATLRYEIE